MEFLKRDSQIGNVEKVSFLQKYLKVHLNTILEIIQVIN